MLFLNLLGPTGMQIYILGIVINLLGITIGTVLWPIANWPFSGCSVEHLRGMAILTVIILLGILLGSLGLWIFSNLGP